MSGLTELLACPFCGETLERLHAETRQTYRYQRPVRDLKDAACPASGFWAYEGSPELTAWNRRALISRTPATGGKP